MAALLTSNVDKNRVNDILKQQTDEKNPGLLAREMDRLYPESSLALLGSVLAGITDPTMPR